MEPTGPAWELTRLQKPQQVRRKGISGGSQSRPRQDGGMSSCGFLDG